MPDTINPSDLIPLSQLVAEGLGASIDELAARLDDALVDDIGRRCTTRETARKLFAQRAENEAAGRVSVGERLAVCTGPFTHEAPVRRGGGTLLVVMPEHVGREPVTTRSDVVDG